MANGFTPLPFGQVEQFRPFSARQVGLERQQKNVQAEQTQLQNDLTLADTIRKQSGTDAALEFWKTTPSSARVKIDKFKTQPGEFDILKITGPDGQTLGGIKVFEDGRKDEPVDVSAFPQPAKQFKPSKPEKPLGRIEAEAEARAKGTAAGKPLKPVEEPRPDIITFTKGNRTVTARRGSAEAKSFRAQGFTEGKITKPVEGQAYLLPDGLTFVISRDGGKTYTTDAGEKVKMPSGSVPADIELRGEALRMMQAQRRAAKDLSTAQAPVGLPSAEEAALGGTGPFAALAAGIEAVVGGIGADLVFGKEGLFPETADNRQSLRIYKQLGKQALINSSRGAVWEQQRIDKLFPDPDKIWRNPRTEARKFKILRETLLTVKLTNLQAIIDSTDPGEVAKLTKSNIDIDRLLAIIKSPGETAGITVSDEDQALLDKYPIEGQ